MTDIKWLEDSIQVAIPKKPKKISGTYFSSVLGYDPWKTPFESWCKSTRTWESPFEGNKYTNAGQIIEGKVFDFLRKSMGFGDRVIVPEDVYGKDHFKKTRGDFFPNNPVFSGMWDALITDDNRKVEYVVEIKTVQVDGRSGNLDERWKNGEAPHYQALQASLYAHLLKADKVLMVAVALKDSEGDYEHPEQVVPSFANNNVYIDEFKISERYPNFEMYVAQAIDWWNKYVLTGISPAFDEKKDAEILKALRTNNVKLDTDIATLIDEAEQLRSVVDAVTVSLNESKKHLDALYEKIKAYALEQFREGDEKVSIRGKHYEFVLAKTKSTEVDKDRLHEDGLLEKYTKIKTSYRLNTNKIKEE